jgi:hypothetical protein
MSRYATKMKELALLHDIVHPNCIGVLGIIGLEGFIGFIKII